MIDDSILREYYSYVDSLGLTGKSYIANMKFITRKYVAFLSKNGLSPDRESIEKFIRDRDRRLRIHYERIPIHRDYRNKLTRFHLTRFLKFLASRGLVSRKVASDFDPVLLEFFSFLETLDLSWITIKRARFITGQYWWFLEDKKLEPGLKSLESFIRNYEKRLQHYRGSSPESRRRNLGNTRFHLIRFLKFLAGKGVIPPLELKPGDRLPDPFQSILDMYCDAMIREDVLAVETREGRRRIAHRFLRWCVKKGVPEIGNINTGLVYDYLRDRFDTSYSHDTIGTTVSDLRGFLRFLQRKGFVAGDIAGNLIMPRRYRHARVPKVMSGEDLARLLISLGGDKPKDIRDRAVFFLLMTYGLRVDEVFNLTLDAFDWENNRLIIRNRKQGDVLELPLTQQTGEAVAQYLKTARPPDAKTKKVFCNVNSRRPIKSANSLRQCIHKRLKACGINASPGCFRHTLASNMVNNGAAYEDIAAVLGHADIESTRIYAKVNLAALREVADNYSMNF